MPDDTSKPNIISYVSRGDACYWYRNKMPIDALKKKGWNVSTLNMGELMDLDKVDIVQFSRVYTNKFEPFLYMLKDRGIKIWYDVDDAVDLVKPFNPFSVANREHMSAFYFLLNEADFITTTNQNLKDHISVMTPKPVSVFPNCINPDEWNMRPRESKAMRVGFAGSPSHFKEINMVLPAIRDLQKRYKFTFVVFGLGQHESMEEWYQASKREYAPIWDKWEYCKEVEVFHTLMQDIDHEWAPAVRWEMYPRRLAKLDLDIGICPLIDDDFNRCKSAIKLYEYALAGTVTLASSVPPFQDEALALADNDYQSWYDALDALLMHDELREKTLAVQREYVLNNKQISDHVPELESILAPYGKKK